ncbi:DUF262 domain-containing protein [Paracoccus sp. (in: a-proteobacteria)]|uniref:DUF262 domain-containing protein n=1 Tax=Paracoccus sp. TaxID=267 RepID=UPI00321F6E14
MASIEGKARTIRELLKGRKYSIDYYQREYKWGEKQARELIDDLTGKFLEEYRPEHARDRVADTRITSWARSSSAARKAARISLSMASSA